MVEAICSNICPVNEHGLGGQLAYILAQGDQRTDLGLKALVAHLEDTGRAHSGCRLGFCPADSGPDFVGVYRG